MLGIRPTAHVAEQSPHHKHGELDDDQVERNRQDHQVHFVLVIEKGEQQAKQPARRHCHQQSGVGVADVIGCQDADERAEQHLAFQCQIEHARLVAKRAAQRRQQNGRCQADAAIEQFNRKNAEKSFHAIDSLLSAY